MSNSGELLPHDDGVPRGDLRKIEQSIRNGWPIPIQRRKALIERMCEITERRTLQVPSSDGSMIERPDLADSHSIAAARVLVAADQVNQTDYWNADKNDRMDHGKATDVHQFQPGKVMQLPLPQSLMDKPDEPGD